VKLKITTLEISPKILVLVEYLLNGNTLSINEDLFMTLLHSGFEVPIRAGGKIVRVDPKGMGVKFKNTIHSI